MGVEEEKQFCAITRLGEAYKARMSDTYFAAARQRRSRLELKITILKAISQGNQRLAHIMYFAKLPPRLAGGIVRTMEQQGLVEILPSEQGRKVKRYVLTERGKRALDSYVSIITQLQLDSLPLPLITVETKVLAEA